MPRMIRKIAQTASPAPTADGLARQALAHSARGNHAAALRAAVHALTLDDGPVARGAFVECLRWMRFDADNALLRQLLLRVLQEEWARPEDVSAQCCDLIRAAGTGLDALAKDALLAVLMVRAINLDAALEQALRAARRQLLMRAMAGEETPLDFHTALARQCFLNEYVFAVDDDEIGEVAVLRTRIAQALDRSAQPSASDVAALASYEALTDSRLLDYIWLPAIDGLLTQQLRETAQERALAEAMPCLTPLSDPVSRAVAAQYETHPYPRWVVAGPAQASADAAVRDILIAGCGTGRNAIETARSFPKAKVLAIDLSRASLGHAARKTQAMGVTNITYAQADLLTFKTETRFDLIEAVGVLHHLADPFAGWRTLLDFLAPGGVMRVGLYSPMARRHISAARAELAGQGFAPTVDGIRAARQYQMTRPEFTEVVQRPDFFSISACRDLLFHAQETCLPLPVIAAFLRQEKLRVLGLDVEAPVLATYTARFADDPDATDLDNWAAFEADHPDTFDGMYQFWVTRA